MGLLRIESEAEFLSPTTFFVCSACTTHHHNGADRE